ncbi:glycosyltransferase family 4 protein [Bdellovibrio bacteriovorus]|uniref:glycosyltransferase family 4 protein n=1 Tax=Bdellovibrio bacteriovorus TaxID=959 RepID=UPI003CFD4492
MRVFFVNQFALRPTDRGSLRHFFLARFLVENGYQAEVVTSDIHYNSRERLQWVSSSESHSGVMFRVIRGIGYKGQLSRLCNHLQCAIKAFFYLLRSVSSNDVVVGSSPQPFLAYSAYLAARVKRARFFYEVRDLWPQTLIDLGGLTRSHPLVRCMFFIERVLASKSEKIIVLMPLAEKYFAAIHGISSSKVVWIGQGVDCSAQVGRSVGRKPVGSYAEIVYAGSIGSANCISSLLEIAGELQGLAVPVHFSIYGEGPERAGLELKAAQLRLKNLDFMGALSRNSVLGKIAEADFAIALAHSSPLYQFGISFNKLFDYFLAARPVIFIGDVAKNPVAEARAGVVVSETSSKAVALAIKDFVAQSPEYLQDLGENGLRFLKANHDHKVTGQKLLDIISSR